MIRPMPYPQIYPPEQEGFHPTTAVRTMFLDAMDEGEARVREAYPGATWDRLVAINTRYDPTNLFHINQNIPPAADRAG
jgi:hypothetical protein